MKVELKKVTVDGKTLQLKVINQLQPLDVIKQQKAKCLGYYIIKKQKKYVFSTENGIFSFVDYHWKNAHSSKTELSGNGNRYKHFSDEKSREDYLSHYKIISEQLNETQLFY